MQSLNIQDPIPQPRQHPIIEDIDRVFSLENPPRWASLNDDEKILVVITELLCATLGLSECVANIIEPNALLIYRSKLSLCPKRHKIAIDHIISKIESGKISPEFFTTKILEGFLQELGEIDFNHVAPGKINALLRPLGMGVKNEKELRKRREVELRELREQAKAPHIKVMEEISGKVLRHASTIQNPPNPI